MKKSEKQTIQEVIYATNMHYTILENIRSNSKIINKGMANLEDFHKGMATQLIDKEDLEDICNGMAISIQKLEELIK